MKKCKVIHCFGSPFFNHNGCKRIEMMANEYKECNENKHS
ncbi:hypothetical protein B4144_0416 [Bacillus atrophaeus]|nr:hypothetical protein B4144_0416 [Bacillus atrophaeus]